jgi:hypothetical protein
MAKRSAWWLGAVVVFGAGCAGAPEASEAEDVASVGGAVDEAPAPGQKPVTFGRATSERAYGVSIHDAPHAKPAIIYSVRLPDLRSTEKLRVRGEVTLSRCDRKDVAGLSGDAAHTPCDSPEMKQHPYTYAPRYAAALVLGDAKDDANGERVSPWFDTTCTEDEHHCALALPEVGVEGLPDAKERWLHLVVSADANGHGASSHDVMEVEQHHGALSVTRLAPNAELHAITKLTKALETKGSMGVDQTEDEGDFSQVRHLVHQVRLDGLHPGDVVDVDAKTRTLLGGYACDPLVTTEVFLTDDPKAREPKKGDVVVSVKNGSNCTDHGKGGCPYRKSGAARLGNDAPKTLYVSFVAMAARSCAAPNGGDRWRFDGGDSALDVNVRR